MGSMCASCTEILVFHREHPCVEIGPSFYLTKGTNRPKETFAGCAGQIEYHGDGINVCLVYGNINVPQKTPCVEIGPSFYLMKGTNRPKEMFAGCAGRIEYHRMGSMCASCTEILVFHREHPCVEIGPSFYLMKGTNRPKETFAGCA
jgi:hypothetical protein